MPRPAVSLDIHIPGSGSAKAGTNAERHTCKLRILAGSFLRAPHKRASGEVRFLLTKTYMEVGNADFGFSASSLPPICNLAVYVKVDYFRVALNPPTNRR